MTIRKTTDKDLKSFIDNDKSVYAKAFEINVPAVDPDYQRRGIAKQVFERCLTDIKDQGMVGVHLITADEGILPAFYVRYGFKKEKEVKI